MISSKMNNTTIILIANAAILVMGTLVQMMNTPARDAILSILFVAWIGLFAWRIISNRTASA